jgi:predicted exporter
MSGRKAWVVGTWLCSIVAAALIVTHARYVTDLSAFLPAHPTPVQRLLVDQLRAGPAARLILIALERSDPEKRAEISMAMAHELREDGEFASVNNGEQLAPERDRAFVFEHRYLLSAAVVPQRFSSAGLRAAMQETIADLASPEGLLTKPLVPRDPTGETLQIIQQLSRIAAPQTRGGVWVSADGERTLLVAQTAAAGSDTDAQEHALHAIRASFAAATRAAGASARGMQLRMSGPGVFAVASRANIERAVVRLSIAASSLIVLTLLWVYRSVPALILGLLPVATGALIGVAAVALGFGAVHGITLGFGVTLIGESVDYSIYFFVQSLRGAPDAQPWQRTLWPTLRLGLLTSVCGFATLLPSGFPGLAQLGAFSISGLIGAAAVTRFVLPELLPPNLAIRDLTPLGTHIARWLDPVRRSSRALRYTLAFCVACVALAVLLAARGSLWNRELSSLSPIPLAEQRSDAELRADLGAPDALDLVVVSGENLEAVLQGAERAGGALEPLIDQKVIGGFDSPANFLPSLATQAARRDSLPEPAALRDNLQRAAVGLALDSSRLAPFLGDVEAARQGALITPDDLKGTSFAAGFGALILHESGRWSALLPLRAVNPAAPRIDAARVGRALNGAKHTGAVPDGAGAARATADSSTAQLLDMKSESDALYAGYLREAVHLSLAGLAAIAALLWVALSTLGRVTRVLTPLILAVLTVAAALALCRVQLTILHLVGMLLIVAVGSNYALFFDRRSGNGGDAGMAAITLASLGVANLCTVIGFGLLAFAGVPVLDALGTTVAPGALLALLFAAVLTPRVNGSQVCAPRALSSPE